MIEYQDLIDTLFDRLTPIQKDILCILTQHGDIYDDYCRFCDENGVKANCTPTSISKFLGIPQPIIRQHISSIRLTTLNLL